MTERWMIVRRSQTIPGGFRVVQAGLTEELAWSWASEYKHPHQAMRERELVELRMDAFSAQRQADTPGG